MAKTISETPPRHRKKKSKKRSPKDKITSVEISLDYDDPIKYNINLQAQTTDVNFDCEGPNKKDLAEVVALELASIVLVKQGLPTIQEMLETHYPESQL